MSSVTSLTCTVTFRGPLWNCASTSLRKDSSPNLQTLETFVPAATSRNWSSSVSLLRSALSEFWGRHKGWLGCAIRSHGAYLHPVDPVKVTQVGLQRAVVVAGEGGLCGVSSGGGKDVEGGVEVVLEH